MIEMLVLYVLQGKLWYCDSLASVWKISNVKEETGPTRSSACPHTESLVCTALPQTVIFRFRFVDSQKLPRIRFGVRRAAHLGGRKRKD
jgi:hypothetical protein